MPRIRALFISVLVLLALASGVEAASPPSSRDEEIYEGIATFTKVLDIVERNYVEEVDPKKLTTGAIEGLIKTLDPHSAYLTPERFKEFEEGTAGKFGGVGLEVYMEDGTLTVIAPIEGSPAERAGVRAGDKIVEIDGKPTAGMNVYDAVKVLRGEEGTEVTLGIRRPGSTKVERITLKREIIHPKSIKFSLKEGGVGYVKITNFQDGTSEELTKALAELESRNGKPLRGLVLDLRNNPGGLLSEAVGVTDAFLKEGVIVKVVGRADDQSVEYKASPGADYAFPMVVLVNKGSASASEVVAEALQDQKRAVILGTRTFGKGSVQTIIKLDDGSGLKLTTAHFYAPSGRTIEHVGVTPDVMVKDVPGKDVQLQRALELLRAR